MTNKSIVAKLNLKNCVGCGICVEFCPNCAIPHSLIGFISSLAKIDLDKCNGCGMCVDTCLQSAIILFNHSCK